MSTQAKVAPRQVAAYQSLRPVVVDAAATCGAQIGVNLLLPDGSLGTVDKLRALFGSTSSTVVGSGPDTTDDLPQGQFNWYGNVYSKDVAATTYTAGQGDNNVILRGTAASGLTISVPAGDFIVGTTLYALQGDAGAVQFVAGDGVTFLPADSAQTRDQGSVIGLKQTSPNVWEPVGDLAYFFPATSVHANPSAADAQPVALAATADKQVLKRVGTTLQWVQQIAADVAFTPAGNLASADVQAALVELDTEKASIPGAETFATAAGTADALTAAFTPAITALVDGAQLKVRAAAANTSTTPTLKVDALTARTITKNGNQPLVAGDIKGAGHELLLRYVAAGPRFELLNPAVSGGGGGSGTVKSVVGGPGINVDSSDPANPVVSATGDSAATGPFTYWRILIRTTAAALSNSSFFSNIAEVEMAESAGGANVCVGGAAFASSAYAGNPASAAFDGIHSDTTHQWSSAYGSFPQWLGYQFLTAKAIKELRIYPVVTVTNRAPADFVVQGSGDGRRWYDVATFTPTNWAENTANVFSL